MKKRTTLILIICILAIPNLFSQTKVLSLANNTGIIEDNLGSVINWGNQIDGYGDATQSVSALGGEQMQETYPGKVNVGFSNDGSFLELEGTKSHISDNSYSVFYVGKANPVGKPASLLGNYDIPGVFSNCSGIRFVKLEDGRICFDYAKPNYVRVTLGTISNGDYFFFGFTMDASGNYRYFDNNSSLIVEGTISNTMVPNNEEDLKFNLFEEKDGGHTYNHTEVVEFSMYEDNLSTTEFEGEFTRLTSEYPELITADFYVSEVLPSQRTDLPVTSPITITCNQTINPTSVYPKVYINKSDTEATGEWVLSPSNTLTFTPSQDWPYQALITVKLDLGLTSTEDVEIDLSDGSSYNFIVESDGNFGAAEAIVIDEMATVDYPQIGHVLPLKLTLPSNRSKKVPVHIWVHGGGWSGGTAALSNAAASPHSTYLAENLGVATMAIAYRCKGSSGSFSLAMEDIDHAYQWAVENADTYNFDMTKVFFSGGSAGTPLAALASQKYASVIGFIGFNGIYDFVNDAGSWGSANDYGQEEPSAEANSPIFQLRSNPPATILMHGDADTTIPYTQSTLFADAINAAGGDAEAVIYPGEVHAFFNVGKPAYEDVLIEMANFMSRILKENTSTSSSMINEVDPLIAYPNPVKKGNILKVHLNSNLNKDKVQVQIVNVLGQTIVNNPLHPVLDSNTAQIDTKALKKGTYILKIVANQSSETLKFVVQ